MGEYKLRDFFNAIKEIGGVTKVTIMHVVNPLAVDPYCKYRYIKAKVYRDSEKVGEYKVRIRHFYNAYGRGNVDEDVIITKQKIKDILVDFNIKVISMN